MQADHARNTREAENEFAQAAQVSCLALLAEVRVNVAGMLVPIACTTLTVGVRTVCYFTHPVSCCMSAGASADSADTLSCAGTPVSLEDTCSGSTTHAARCSAPLHSVDANHVWEYMHSDFKQYNPRQ